MQRLQDLGRLLAIYVQMTGIMTIYGHRVDLCTELKCRFSIRPERIK